MRKNYMKPGTEIVNIRLYGSVLEREHDGMDVVSGEGNGIIYVGAKENDGLFDDDPFGSLWDDDPVEDPFAIGD